MSTEDHAHPADRAHGKPGAAGVTDLQLAVAPGAGAIRRVTATLVDMVVFSGLSALLAYPLIGGVDWTSALASYDTAVQTLSDTGFVTHASGVLGLWTAAWWCYFVVGWGGFGATPGKRLLGLCLIDHRGRLPIGMPRAALRLVAYMVSSLTLGIGHLLVLLRSDRRALHDILAGTRVVRRPRTTRRARTSSRNEARPRPSGPASARLGPESGSLPGSSEVQGRSMTLDRDQEAVLQSTRSSAPCEPASQPVRTVSGSAARREP